MESVFKLEQLENSRKQRKKVLTFFFIALGLYLAISVGVLIYYTTLTYKSPKIITVKIVEYSLTAIMIIFSFVYMGITYKRVNNYYKQCLYMRDGLKETNEVYFFEYDNGLVTKDGVDMKTLIFLQWNQFKKNFYERKVYVFYDTEFPQFTENQKIKIITRGNVLYEYEILEDGE